MTHKYFILEMETAIIIYIEKLEYQKKILAQVLSTTIEYFFLKNN